MAEDEKTPKEAAETPPKEPKERPSRQGRKVDPPVSLHPLSFEEAIEGLLRVRLEPEDKKQGPYKKQK